MSIYERTRESARQNDNAPPRKRHKKARHSPIDFSNMLAEAALQNEVTPLLTKDKTKIRLRALQHMIVCNLRRDLAGEVKVICDTESAPPDQMERVRKLMKHYGLQATLSRYNTVSHFVTQTLNAKDSLCAARLAVHAGTPKPERRRVQISDR